jgi:succinate-semialdehyde dehydrogenase / glutarate-semialdehyde dehydrogenase
MAHDHFAKHLSNIRERHVLGTIRADATSFFLGLPYRLVQPQYGCTHGMMSTSMDNTSNTMLASFNPATGDLLGQVPIATLDDVTLAVGTARQAQKQWAAISLQDRVSLITRAYHALDAPFAAGIAQLLSMEMGKDLTRATDEVTACLESGPSLAHQAGQALRPIPLQGGTQSYVPLGVVGVISPWNYPVEMAHNLIVPALMAGNSVVLKPSEQTPLVADQFFGRLARELPESLLTILHGDSNVGQLLVESDIQMIAFTGSLAAGRDIMQRAALKIKRLVMELGGNDPMIVMKDADLERAARLAVEIGLENSGQMCTSIERVYVDASVAAEFEKQVIHYSRHYETKVGPWHQGDVEIGPIINLRQFDKIVQHLKDAETKGGRFIVGSSHHKPPYIRPTIVSGMTRDMKLEQEETFGPVLGISTFSHIQEAIDRANDSEFGLGAIVFGHEGAQEVAQALEAGMVGINQGQGGTGPWVGAKQSGFGYHGTKDGHRQFAQVKVIAEEDPDKCHDEEDSDEDE